MPDTTIAAAAPSSEEAGEVRTMAEPMTEEKLAELETAFQEAERNDRVNRENRVGDGPGALLAQFSGAATAKALTAARRALADGQAQFERERRFKAEAETASIVAANQRMADASEAAARSSAEAAQASRRAAFWTCVAAVFAAAAVAVQAWQVWQTTSRQPTPASLSGPATPGGKS